MHVLLCTMIGVKMQASMIDVPVQKAVPVVWHARVLQ
jgi:hypothetical protein